MRNPLLIGIDGGATKVTGYLVAKKDKHSFTLEGKGITRIFNQYDSYNPIFNPVDINTQLADLRSGNCRCLESEYEHGKSFVNAIVDVIAGLCNQHKSKNILVGIGMPGLKTPNGKGIAVLANGPRIPELASLVEMELQNKGIVLYAPIAKLGSDADYCGIGEEYAVDGAFRNYDNAYYLGGGTGVADALKLDGKLVPFDHTKSWLAKSWEFASEENLSLERYISSKGIQWLYSRYSGATEIELEKQGIYGTQILEKAETGDQNAQKTLDEVARKLAKLIFSRITTLFFGYRKEFDLIDPHRSPIEDDHPFTGTLLDRIIIGQRLGNLMEKSRDTSFLYQPFLAYLNKYIQELNHPALNVHYLYSNQVNEALIHISNLREAPVIGAAVDALLSKG